jgi:hypothetical protein
MSASSTEIFKTINQTLTSVYGSDTFFNFTLPTAMSESEKIATLTALSATNLEVVLAIKHDNVFYAASIPPILNTNITFHPATIDGDILTWSSDPTRYPKLIGTNTTATIISGLSTSAFWVIQEGTETFSAINSLSGDSTAAFSVPTTNWLRYTGKNYITDGQNTPVILDDSYIVTEDSYFYESPPEPESAYFNIYNANYTTSPTFVFEKDDTVILEESNERENIIFFYATKISTETVNNNTITTAILIPGPVTSADFYDINNYLKKSSEYKSEKVINNPTIKYGNDREFGHSRIRRLRVLGLI